MNKGSEKMQEQLTFKKLVEFVDKNRNKIPMDTKVFLGDDDELNGIHCAWYIENDTESDIHNFETELDYAIRLDKDNNILIS